MNYGLWNYTSIKLAVTPSILPYIGHYNASEVAQ